MNKVVVLYNQGASHDEIAAGAGISISAVARAIRRARNNGELPEKQPADPKMKLTNALKQEVIMEVVADLADGEDAQTTSENIYRKMQRIQLEYFGEII